MEPLDERSLVMWIFIVAIVGVVALTGMFLNRFFIRRAHRRALAELKYVGHEGADDQSIDRRISSE